MNKILVLAGKKQSGKTTATNFVVGYTMTQYGRSGIPYLPTRFTIDTETGELIINIPKNPALLDKEQIDGEGILNLYTKDPYKQQWLEDCVYPYVKPYAFADELKATASNVFGIPLEWSNGTEEDKKRLTNVKWEDMCALLPARIVSRIKQSEKYDKKMSVREFLQYFGTNICRRIYDDCWVESCLRRIEMEEPILAIISDCRFKNEIKACRKVGAKIVKLERSIFTDLHESEVDLEKVHRSNFDLIIPKDVGIKEQNQLILDAMYEWGWFEQHIGLEGEDG